MQCDFEGIIIMTYGIRIGKPANFDSLHGMECPEWVAVGLYDYVLPNMKARHKDANIWITPKY